MTTSTTTARTATGVRIDRSDSIGLIRLDVPERPQNVLSPELVGELERAIETMEDDREVEAVVLTSAKPDSFMAGADVQLIHTTTDADTAIAMARGAQELTSRIEACRKPVVAAVQGACLGAGLELAIACRERVAAADEATTFGSPEVQLGLIPGAGGTQRLPQLVGLIQALELMTTGSELTPSRARRRGLVDDVVHPEILLPVAIERARDLASAGPDGTGGDGWVDRARSRAVEGNPVGRRVVLRKAQQRVEQETKGNMPAPLRVIEVVQTGLEEGVKAGLEAEARAFGELAVSRVSYNLRTLFLAREAAKRQHHADAAPRSVTKVGVVGAGTMGAGIAEVTSTKAGIPVRMRDIDLDKVRSGLRYVAQVIYDVRRMDREAGTEVLGRITTSVNARGFGDASLAVEAVVEDPQVKHKVFQQLDAELPAGAIIATNTSSIPLAELARSLEHPQRLVGMHYFSPVGKVPLLEVIKGEQTSPTALATAADIGRRQGKTVIVVGDGPGFYTSRILARYLNEAAIQATEGVPVDRIDDALERAGFAVGPFRLLDDVGIDVSHGIAGVLGEAFGDRFDPPDLLGKLVEEERYGAKNGRGIYRYTRKHGEHRRTGDVDLEVVELLGKPSPVDRSRQEIAERCILQMADEAVRCLDESILQSATDGDLGAVLGLGFPPHLGGPFRYLDDREPAEAADRMQSLATSLRAARWAPADRLARTGREGRTFHDDRR